ncbi:MAG TPA: methionyl-tRNA formyltransferase, partial [bacterium]|nr:methionyl-tRNA formyltransferase [bacterium]HOL35915.1 methionyl-tRNA formyltransferase [bacterium]
KITPGPIKIWAQNNNIPVLQPEKLKDNIEFLNLIKSLKPDLFVVISYGKIIPKEYLKIPRIAPINVHPSLLPEYRGPAPMEWALMDGKKQTGVSVIFVTDDVDAGNIISQKSTFIEDRDNIFTLREKLSKIAVDVLTDSLVKLKNGYRGKQQEGKVSYAPKLKKTDGRINWSNSATSIHNRIRAFADWPGTYTFLVSNKGCRMLKIISSTVEKDTGIYESPGRFVDLNKKILVACGEGILRIERLQEQGKKQQNALDYLNGHFHLLKDGHFE